MSPAFNFYGYTLIVLAEWKSPVYDNTKGIILVSATTRRNSPSMLGEKREKLFWLDAEDIGNDIELLTDNDKMLSTSTPDLLWVITMELKVLLPSPVGLSLLPVTPVLRRIPPIFSLSLGLLIMVSKAKPQFKRRPSAKLKRW